MSASTATAATTAPTTIQPTVAIPPPPAVKKAIAATTSEEAAKPPKKPRKPRIPDPAIVASIPQNSFRILLTGFGPFYHYKENPSWLAVDPLHNVVIAPESLTSPVTIDGKPIALEDASGNTRPIHITAIRVPMTYEAVADTVPGLHARPPVLPSDDEEGGGEGEGEGEEGEMVEMKEVREMLKERRESKAKMKEKRPYVPPPAHGYDLIFHVGVAGRGPLRMERLGHKLGYHMKDASGKLATIVQTSPKGDTATDDRLVAENMERERLGMEIVQHENQGGETTARPSRGFGTGYDNFPDELMTGIDVLRMVGDLKKSGTEQIYTSMDAGHYLADFMYYCSLAESRRHVKPYEKKRTTQVLFMHCPPVGRPLSTEDVTEAIKRILVWLCNELINMDDSDDDGPGPSAPTGAVKPGSGKGSYNYIPPVKSAESKLEPIK